MANSDTDGQSVSVDALGQFEATATSALGDADAELLVALPNNTRFSFAATATSSSATGSGDVNSNAFFLENFDVTEPTRVVLSAVVVNPVNDNDALAQVVVNDGNQAVSLAILNDTGGMAEKESLVFLPVVNPVVTGLHSISGTIFTNASVAGSHTGSIFGTVTLTLPADIDVDLAVTAADLAIWSGGYSSTNATFETGDVNGDRRVNGADFFLWQRGFGRVTMGTLSAIHSVPEPASVLLWAMAVCTFGLRRNRIAHPTR